jgi:hypothetical protein
LDAVAARGRALLVALATIYIVWGSTYVGIALAIETEAVPELPGRLRLPSR